MIVISKAEEAGRTVIKVNPSYTSQDCSQCGHRNLITLATRIYHCWQCRLAIHRDRNGATSAQPLPKSGFRCSTHAFGVAEAIELGRGLGNLPQYLVVYGIEGKNFAAGVGLSAEVEEVTGEAVRQALAAIRHADSKNRTFS
jgi:DNA-binding transcriptional LysR family regulator